MLDSVLIKAGWLEVVPYTQDPIKVIEAFREGSQTPLIFRVTVVSEYTMTFRVEVREGSNVPAHKVPR